MVLRRLLRVSREYDCWWRLSDWPFLLQGHDCFLKKEEYCTAQLNYINAPRPHLKVFI